MRRFLPSISALQAFEAAGRHLSFTRAAEDLRITQSGVSRQIGALESFLGARLFERVGSRLVLTEAGAAYLTQVGDSLGALERASIDMVRGRGLEDALVLAVEPTLATRWLTPRLAGFVQAHPEVVVELREAHGRPAALEEPPADPADAPPGLAVPPLAPGIDFRRSRVDLALLRGAGIWPGARAQALFPERLVVVATPGLIAPGAVPEVLDFTQLPSLQNAARPDLWLSWLRASGRAHRGAIRGPRLPTSEMLIAAALNGLGMAVVPHPYVEKELAEGRLWTPFGPAVDSGESFWLVQSETRSPSAAAQAFRTWLLRQARR